MAATNKIDRKKWMRVLMHIIVILMLFILPDLLFNYGRPASKVHPSHIFGVYFKWAVFIAVFYLNYYFLIKRTLLSQKRRWWTFIGINLLMVVGAITLVYFTQHSLLGWWQGTPRHQPSATVAMVRLASFFLRDAGMLVLIIALSVAMRQAENWDEVDKHRQQLQASQTAEELESLKSQLNPHFLFNTLNTIYALVEISPKQAQEAVHELSALLRYVLYENPTHVKLSQEVSFAKSYISLMEMRLGRGSVVARFDVAEDVDVAPLLFITLIENAFKHGNTGVKGQPIEISIESDSDGTVVCRTSNHFVAKGSGADKVEGGIGISNLRRRLQLIYGRDARLDIAVEDDVYTATLVISNKKQ